MSKDKNTKIKEFEIFKAGWIAACEELSKIRFVATPLTSKESEINIKSLLAVVLDKKAEMERGRSAKKAEARENLHTKIPTRKSKYKQGANETMNA